MKALIAQTIVYFFTSCLCIYIENWVIHHKEELREKRDQLVKKAGIDREEDARIITGR